MFRTLALTGIGLLVAAGGPMAYFGAVDYLRPAEVATAANPPPAAAAAAPGQPAVAPVALEQHPIVPLEEALSFGVTPAWVVGRWPRVSVGLGQIQLQGYRVPLVTGTAEDDLAGSATYYFTPRQTLQRITFYGSTGNADRLVRLLAGAYRFTRRDLNAPNLWVYEVPEREGPAKSVLRMELSPILRHDEASRRFTVSLSLERPAG